MATEGGRSYLSSVGSTPPPSPSSSVPRVITVLSFFSSLSRSKRDPSRGVGTLVVVPRVSSQPSRIPSRGPDQTLSDCSLCVLKSLLSHRTFVHVNTFVGEVGKCVRLLSVYRSVSPRRRGEGDTTVEGVLGFPCHSGVLYRSIVTSCEIGYGLTVFSTGDARDCRSRSTHDTFPLSTVPESPSNSTISLPVPPWLNFGV